MNIRNLSPNVSISDQIGPEEVAELRALGFKSIVGLRPDGEGEDQPSWSDIEAAAREAGLEGVHIPVVPGQLTDEQALRFRTAFAALPKPVLAFCRTGMRAAQIWALAARDRLSTEEVLRTVAAAGCDLEGMRARIESGPDAEG